MLKTLTLAPCIAADAAHGMIFKSLMVAGCLAALQSDFAALSPAMPLLPTATAAMSVVHLLRKLVLAFAIGFCFSPAAGRDHSVGEMRKQFHTAAAKPGGTEEGSATLTLSLSLSRSLTLTLTLALTLALILTLTRRAAPGCARCLGCATPR